MAFGILGGGDPELHAVRVIYNSKVMWLGDLERNVALGSCYPTY